MLEVSVTTREMASLRVRRLVLLKRMGSHQGVVAGAREVLLWGKLTPDGRGAQRVVVVMQVGERVFQVAVRDTVRVVVRGVIE